MKQFEQTVVTQHRCICGINIFSDNMRIKMLGQEIRLHGALSKRLFALSEAGDNLAGTVFENLSHVVPLMRAGVFAEDDIGSLYGIAVIEIGQAHVFAVFDSGDKGCRCFDVHVYDAAEMNAKEAAVASLSRYIRESGEIGFHPAIAAKFLKFIEHVTPEEIYQRQTALSQR